MDFADLRLLQEISDRGSFTAAADALHLSQPAVSARVAAVERAVGAALFTRTTRGARLTPAGERYLGYTRRAARLLADGARAAAAESARPGWTVGLPASYAPALAPLLIDAAANQGQQITLRTGHSQHLCTDVVDGLLDLAVTTQGPLPIGLTRSPLIDTPIIAVSAPDRRRPDRYAVHSWSSVGVDAVVTDLLGRGVPRHSIALVSPATTALALAEYHHYLAVVPELTAWSQLTIGSLVRRETRLPRVHTSLEWTHPANRSPNSELDTLARTVREQLHQLSA